MINDSELRVVGMSRSGNHAIIHWITRQIDGRYCFLNCAEPKTNPFDTARPMIDNDVYEVNYEGFALDAEANGNLSRKDCLIHSYEDCFLGMVASKVFEENHDAWVGGSRRRLDVLIIRDPFNLFASRRRSQCTGVTEATALRIWKQHAREVLGKSRYLDQQRVFIRYNDWVRDVRYRRRIAEALGLAFTDSGAHTVRSVARGSSFDGCRYDGQANRMNVLQRWRHYADNPDYLTLFDDETVCLSKELHPDLAFAHSIPY